MAASPCSVGRGFSNPQQSSSPDVKKDSNAAVAAVARKKLETVDGDRASRDDANSLITGVTDGTAQSTTKLLNERAAINATDKNGCTALFQAIKWSKKAIVQVLLNAGADPNIAGKSFEDPTTPLYIASLGEDLETVQALLKAGANPNAADGYGGTPLHSVARWGKTEIVQTLLSGGADPNAADKFGRTPLHEATMRGCLAALQALLDAKADPNIAENLFDGKTPLHMAAWWGHKAVFLEHRDVGVNMVQALLKARANPNAADGYGNTPLYDAAEAGYEPIVRGLLDAGADPNLLTVENFDHIDSQSCALSLVKEGFNKKSHKELLDHWIAKKWSTGELEDSISPEITG